MAQTWFAAQAAFNQPEHEAWWLRDPVTGTAIDCNGTSGGSNCWGYAQGAPGRLYDWRIPAVRDYFTQKVIAPYVDCENISDAILVASRSDRSASPLARRSLACSRLFSRFSFCRELGGFANCGPTNHRFTLPLYFGAF